MVLKYLVKDYPIQTLYFGIANVVANGLVMLRCVLFETLIWLGEIRGVVANYLAALSCFGFLRTSKMITLITWRCEVAAF